MSTRGLVYVFLSVSSVMIAGIEGGAVGAAMAALSLVFGASIAEDIHDHNDNHRSDKKDQG